MKEHDADVAMILGSLGERLPEPKPSQHLSRFDWHFERARRAARLQEAHPSPSTNE